ncbi:hypothetical protein ACFSCX_04605 [Bacillus salitolerans]|uniref:RNA polymerase subunit sigma n=1 Tax=Bacillus salitolerans TaxID=1437434 RepID=A0ABW4LKX0_9BACI
MSLKLVELQVALPRTQIVGKIHDQMEHRGQVMQENIVASKLKEEDRKRKQVQKNDQKEKSSLKSEDGTSNSTHYLPLEAEDKKQVFQKQQHPYKGKSIDISG